MTTLAANLARSFEGGNINELPMVATDIIYEGAAVGTASGLARPLVAGDPFHGFAEAKADNAAGAASAVNVRVKERGKVQLTIASIAVADVGKKVYASDDNTFTLTATDNTLIGRVHRYVGANTCIVDFQPTTI